MSKPKSKVITVRVVGPLSPYAPQFASQLAERGYTPLSRVRQLQVMVHLSKWLRDRGLDVVDVTFERVDEYLAGRRAEGYTAFCSRASLEQLLDELGRCGAPLVEPARSASEVDTLLAFARREELRPAPVDPAALLPQLEVLARHTIGSRIRCELQVKDTVWPVLVDSHRLEVALLNLVVNARDAMPGGGRVVIEARNLTAGEAAEFGWTVEFRQSNREGELVDWLQEAGRAQAAGELVGAVLNAGAYTHTSLAIPDAITASSLRVIELHISNVYAREVYRHHSYLSAVAAGVIVGLGVAGYPLAVRALHDITAS